MPGYIQKKLQEYEHVMPKKPQHCPYSPEPKQFGSEAQRPLPGDSTPFLDDMRNCDELPTISPSQSSLWASRELPNKLDYVYKIKFDYVYKHICLIRWAKRDIYVKYLYSKKKPTFPRRLNQYSFSTYRTSYFYLKSCLIFFKLDEV